MNKADLVVDLAAELGISKTQAKNAVSIIFSRITDGMINEGKVTVVDFGSFIAVNKPARTARNPRTGESVEVPERIVPRFKAARALKELVKGTVASETVSEEAE